MKSGLEDRNNFRSLERSCCGYLCLNEVRPGRPEQWPLHVGKASPIHIVSMKSGLEDRNNRQSHNRHASRYPVSMKSGLEDRNN